MTDHKATPEQWTALREYVQDNYDEGYAACILELRARVEALEVAITEQNIVIQGEPLRKPPQALDGSLVERVARAMNPLYEQDWATCETLEDEAALHTDARAAIREVAAWLIDRRRDDDWLAPFEELADLLLEEAQQ